MCLICYQKYIRNKLGLSCAKLKLGKKLKRMPGFEAVDDTVQRLGDENMHVEARDARDAH